MIRVDRNRSSPRFENQSPIKPSDAWFASALRATDQAIAEGDAHQVSHLYRHSEVKYLVARVMEIRRKVGERREVRQYLEGLVGIYLADDALHAGVARAVARDART